MQLHPQPCGWLLNSILPVRQGSISHRRGLGQLAVEVKLASPLQCPLRGRSQLTTTENEPKPVGHVRVGMG